MTRLNRTASLVLGLIVVAATSVSAPAGSYAASTSVKVEEDPNSTCIAQALASRADSWTCLGDELTTTKRDASGKEVTSTEQVQGSTSSIVFEDLTQESAGSNSAFLGAVTTASASDDYDTWCESATVCGRKISDFIAVVKGNMAYGDSKGAIGNVDVIIRQSFNGPWPKWRGTLIWDRGPAITTSEYKINCRINKTGPDGNCGGIKLYFNTISSGNQRSDRPSTTGFTQNSDKLVANTKYHDDALGTFKATGYSATFKYGTLHTGRWQSCSKNCKYYQVPWTP